jgi:hypothetical protein
MAGVTLYVIGGRVVHRCCGSRPIFYTDPDHDFCFDTDPNPAFNFDMDSDPTFHFDINPDPNI